MNGIVISSEEYLKAVNEEIERIKSNPILSDKEKKFTVIAYERQKSHLKQNEIIPVKTIIENKTYYAVKIPDKIDNEVRQQISKEALYIKKIEMQLQ